MYIHALDKNKQSKPQKNLKKHTKKGLKNEQHENW